MKLGRCQRAGEKQAAGVTVEPARTVRLAGASRSDAAWATTKARWDAARLILRPAD